jgi:hypothetical protein
VVGIEDHGLLESRLEKIAVGAEAVVVVGQVLELLPGVRALDGRKDRDGIAVEGLSREAQALRLVRHGAVGAVEDGGGVGDPKWRG